MIRHRAPVAGLAAAIAFAAPAVARPPDPPVTAPEPSPVDYLLVTDAAFVDAFGPLVAEKEARGLVVRVRTVDEVARAAPGRDLAERIRTYVRMLHERNALRFVLLGGDAGVVPTRMLVRSTSPELDTPVAGDLYFACLEGTWDEDEDGQFGEWIGDQLDLTAEVAVGRAPVGTPAEAEAFVAKTLAYRALRDDARRDRVLFLAEKWFPNNWPFVAEGWIHDVLDSSAASFETTRMYGDTTGYPGSLPLTRGAALAALDAGTHGTVLHLGRADCEALAVQDSTLDGNDLEALANGFPFVLGSVFNTSGLEGSCPAERLVRHASGGAVLSLGHSGPTHTIPARDVLGAWVRAIHRDGVATAGEAQVLALNTMDEFQARYAATWILLGDPELDVGPRFPAPAPRAAPPAAAPGLAMDPVRPNPLSPRGSAEVGFTLARGGRARVAAYDVAGRRVLVLADRPFAAGRHALAWSGNDAGGQPVPAGVYFVRIEAFGAAAARRVLVLPAR